MRRREFLALPAIVAGVLIALSVPSIAGATVAVPLWAKFMTEATRGDKPAWFTTPDTVVAAEVCPISGRLATTSCTDHRRQYFISGTAPVEYCDVHQPSFFKKIFGLATVKPVEPAPIDASLAPVKAPEPAIEELKGKDVNGKEPEAPVKKRGLWSRMFHGNSGK